MFSLHFSKYWRSCLLFLMITAFAGGIWLIIGCPCPGYDMLVRPRFVPSCAAISGGFAAAGILLGLSGGAATADSGLGLSFNSLRSDPGVRQWLCILICATLWPLLFYRLEWRLMSAVVLAAAFVMAAVHFIRRGGLKKIHGRLLLPVLVWLGYMLYNTVALWLAN